MVQTLDYLLTSLHPNIPKIRVKHDEYSYIKIPETAIFKEVLEFLKLPAWDLREYKSYNSRNKDTVEINPATRERLVDYFKPHNQRLYQLLDLKFDWDCGQVVGASRTLNRREYRT